MERLSGIVGASVLVGLLAICAMAMSGEDDSLLLDEEGRLPPGIPVHSYYDTLVQLEPDVWDTLCHNLGGNPLNYLVFVYGYNDAGFHHANYGTASYGVVEKWIGAEWRELDEYCITVLRAPEDDVIGSERQWAYARVLIIRVK
jgi:hypothetical protein